MITELCILNVGTVIQLLLTIGRGKGGRSMDTELPLRNPLVAV